MKSRTADVCFAMFPVPEGPLEGVKMLEDPHVVVVARDDAHRSAMVGGHGGSWTYSASHWSPFAKVAALSTSKRTCGFAATCGTWSSVRTTTGASRVAAWWPR